MTLRFSLALISLAAAAAAQPFATWAKYRDITVNTTNTGGGANVSAAVSNFPLLVRLTNAGAATGSDVLSEALPGGADLRFSDSSGTDSLAFEIEQWTATEAQIWVRVPGIAASGNTKIRMYWGKIGQSAASSGSRVFNSAINDFKVVFHFNNNVENSTNVSLSPVNNGTTDITSTALIGRSRSFGTASSTTSYINLGTSTADDGLQTTEAPHTVSAWVYSTGTATASNNWHYILSKGASSTEEALRITVNSSTTARWEFGNWNGTNYYAATPNSAFANLTGSWHFLVGTSTGSGEGGVQTLYVDGAQAGTATNAAATSNPTDNWYVGRFGTASGRNWRGYMDEVRIAGAVRSAAWIKLEYETQKANVTAVTLGTTIAPPPSGLSYSPNPAVYTVGYAIPGSAPAVTGAVTGYSVSPTLPAGLVLDTNTGVISGTPTTAQAAANYTITATNAAGSTTVQLNITVNPVLVAPSGLSYSAPAAVYGLSGPITPNTPTVTGTVTAYSVSPALPAGLTLNTTTGVISGTPTAATPAGNYTVTAGNSAGSTTATVNITVLPPPSGLSYSVPAASYFTSTAITPNTPTVTGAVTAYSVTPALPAGLILNAATGVISGTPTSISTASNYTVTASNSSGSASATVNITVSGPPSSLNYSINPVSYTLNQPISPNTPTVTGTVTRFSISPTLSAGLALDTLTGTISGTPTASTSASVAYEVSAGNPAGSSTTTLYIWVLPVSAIAPALGNAFEIRISGNLSIFSLPNGAKPVRFSILDLKGRRIWTQAVENGKDASWDGRIHGGSSVSGAAVLRLDLADAEGRPLPSLERKITYSP